MNAAAMRGRVKRLKTLADGLSKEGKAVLADRGELTPQEWNQYLTAVGKADTALRDAHMVLAVALGRIDGKGTR